MIGLVNLPTCQKPVVCCPGTIQRSRVSTPYQTGARLPPPSENPTVRPHMEKNPDSFSRQPTHGICSLKYQHFNRVVAEVLNCNFAVSAKFGAAGRTTVVRRASRFLVSSIFRNAKVSAIILDGNIGRMARHDRIKAAASAIGKLPLPIPPESQHPEL